MEFQHQTHQEVYEKVSKYLKELFGELVKPMDNITRFVTMPMGSAIAYVNVIPWTDDEVLVNVRSYVVMGAEITEDLMKFLLQKNNEVYFGAFGLDNDDDIFFEHTILGSTLDKEELKTSILSVLNITDKFDDEIRSRWGGQRAMDQFLGND